MPDVASLALFGCSHLVHRQARGGRKRIGSFRAGLTADECGDRDSIPGTGDFIQDCIGLVFPCGLCSIGERGRWRRYIFGEFFVVAVILQMLTQM